MSIIKFAVWGAGIRGKRIVNLFGDKVACIIDSNSDYYNMAYKDIPIISYDEYRCRYVEYPVMITPARCEMEIKHQLEENGIYNFFTYSDNIDLINAFNDAKPINNFLKKHNFSKKFIIYGGGILGIFLYNYLKELGCWCDLILQSGYVGNLNEKKKIKEWTGEWTKDLQIILSVPPTEEDKIYMTAHGLKYEKYYEIFDTYLLDSYYNFELEQFKGIHQGERCFIVATGPSLKIEDLNTLARYNEICFSVNGIFSAFDYTEWRPNYYIIGDLNAVSRWRREIAEEKIGDKFIVDDALGMLGDEKINGSIHYWHLFRNARELKFSEDFAKGAFLGYTITYDGALQLAVYMGFAEIYLLGVDFDYQEGKKGNHFYSDNQEDTGEHFLNKVGLAYERAEQFSREHGFRIYNATRGGELEVFERVNFDSLFSE